MNIFSNLKEGAVNFFEDILSSYEKSNRWKEYKIGPTKTHCKLCFERQNKIYDKDNIPKLPEHLYCLCYLRWLKKVSIGQATKQGLNGVDVYLFQYGKLPDYYITKEEAEQMGWIRRKGNLCEIAPGKTLGGNVYKNKEGKLPSAPGRIWYECDIDYDGGYRNNSRLVYSNDGLIFRTDSHYTSFVAVE